MGIMMTADEFFRMYFSPELPSLKVEEVMPFLKTTHEVDTAERAYNLVIDLVAQNNENFSTVSRMITMVSNIIMHLFGRCGER